MAIQRRVAAIGLAMLVLTIGACQSTTTDATSPPVDPTPAASTGNDTSTWVDYTAPDDAFALKSECSLGKALPTENITVRDSSFSASIANAIQIGSETWGNFENISWSNIRILGGAKSGIGIQMNDGAVIKNLSYDNITLTNTSFPIFIRKTQAPYSFRRSATW